MILYFVRNLLIVFVLNVFLASCAFHMDSMSSDLLELGQDLSHEGCKKKYVNYKDYQACIGQVDENYDEAYK